LSIETISELLEAKQEAGQLETYVQQKLVEIKQIREAKSKSNNNSRVQERERERQQNLTEQQQLQTEITNLETNPNKTTEQQAEYFP
jgi:hypothetical protein